MIRKQYVLKHLHNDIFCILVFFSTGNFGVVHEAWYTKENIQYKVAIKTLKGDCYITYIRTSYI